MRLADEWREEMEGPNQDVSESEATEETPEAHESPGLVNSSFKVDEYETPDEDEASDSEDPGSDSSENKMGGENKTLTRGDMQVMARLVAGMSAQEWKSLSRTGRWERMAKKVSGAIQFLLVSCRSSVDGLNLVSRSNGTSMAHTLSTKKTG
jgi:hypothetical protein